MISSITIVDKVKIAKEKFQVRFHEYLSFFSYLDSFISMGPGPMLRGFICACGVGEGL